uniref:Proteasome assembly chaperone 1 n=1 Tax=Ailuropoda melanoleuca TaxID=9646 RepID=A0A7N5K7G4_AILME
MRRVGAPRSCRDVGQDTMAATFFGEVVRTPCRAGTEDQEEEEEGRRETAEDREVRRQLSRKREVRLFRRQTKTSLEVSLLEKYPCSKFIIAIGNNAVAFLSSFVMNSGVWEEVGCAKLWNEWCRTTDTTHLSPAEAFCVFYHLKSNPSVFGSCARKNMQVTVLTCRHVTDYKTSESTSSLHSPFLKALKTQNFKEPPCCPLLEQPNIVHDLPAAVLSYCQVWKIPAVLYLCYTDVMKLDLITVEAFKPILSSRSLKGLVKNALFPSTTMLASPRVLEPSFGPAEQGAEVIFPSLVVWPPALLEHQSVWVYDAASQSQRTRSHYSWVPAHLFRLASIRSAEACLRPASAPPCPSFPALSACRQRTLTTGTGSPAIPVVCQINSEYLIPIQFPAWSR